MRVGAERKAEMPHVGGAVISLGLAAQDLLHDLRLFLRLADAVDQAVEGGRLDDLPQREIDVEGR